jgi:small subunit ribosomal protein S19e
MDRKAFVVKDVSAPLFIAEYAAYLKRTDKITIPSWVDYVKTGKNRQLAPYDKDWLYIRAAALARKVYLRPNIGVGALKKVYGGSKNFGTTPCHYVEGSGKIIRYLLQELEDKGIIETYKEEDSERTQGRRITRKGQQELDSIAKQVKV